jgi:hypothetical protein
MEIVIEIANMWSNLSMYWIYNRGIPIPTHPPLPPKEKKKEEESKKRKIFKQVTRGKEQRKASFIIVSVAKDV